jgi:Protein of unknown function (DUF2911)
MKIWHVTVMALSLGFAASGTFSALRAQQAAAAPDPQTQRCVNWIKATVPVAELRGLDPADFCSGVQTGNFGAWSSVFHCGVSSAPTGTSPKYCASWGEIREHETWAAGFSSTTKDGHELFDESSDSSKNAQRNAVTFYSRTPVWMGSLRVPAGMYKLTPSRSPDGWSLAVARLEGEWNDAKAPQQNLGTVEMKNSDNPTLTDSLYFELGKDYLEIWAGNFAAGCGKRPTDFNGRELHFILGSTDLLVCIRPEHSPESQRSNISGD